LTGPVHDVFAHTIVVLCCTISFTPILAARAGNLAFFPVDPCMALPYSSAARQHCQRLYAVARPVHANENVQRHCRSRLTLFHPSQAGFPAVFLTSCRRYHSTFFVTGSRHLHRYASPQICCFVTVKVPWRVGVRRGGLEMAVPTLRAFEGLEPF
jgi:hypothetical protein